MVVGLIAALGVVACLGWFVWSLFRLIFSSDRAGAANSIKRSLIATVVCLATLIFAIQSDTDSALERRQSLTAAVERSEAMNDSEASEEQPGVELPENGPVPTNRPEDAPATSNAEPEKLSDTQEFVWIRGNQRILKRKLRDPDSAKFANEYVSYKSGGPVVCGTVNSKNGFGGYTGPVHYIGMGETIGVYLATEVDGFSDLWAKVC